MNADARHITHHDQTLGEAALEEIDAAFFWKQRFRFAIGHQVEADQQSLSAHIRDRAKFFRQRFKTVAQQSADLRGILHQFVR